MIRLTKMNHITFLYKYLSVRASLFIFFLIISAPIAAQHLYKGVSCKISVPKTISFEGPAFLTLTFSYSGKGEALMSQINPMVEMAAPTAWKKRHDFSLLNGFTFPYLIKSGEKKEIAFNLHEYFSEMTPGEFRIPFRLNIFLNLNGEKQNWIIIDTLNINVHQSDPAAAERYARLMTDSISKNYSPTEKVKWYKELLSMHFDHVIMMQSCLECIENNTILEIHPACKRRLSELAIKYNALDTLYNYIMKYGSYDDDVIFLKVSRAKKQFTPKQVQNLIKHSDPWIGFYTLQYCNVPNKENEISRLKEKLGELTKALDELEREK